MVTTRKSAVDKNARVNPDTMMEDAVQNEPLDCQGEDPTSRQDRVSTEDTTYLEDEEEYVQDGYYKDGCYNEKDPELVQVAEELAVTKAKLAEQERVSEKMQRMMERLQRKFGDLGDSDEDASVLGGVDATTPDPAAAGPSKAAPNKGKEKVGGPVRTKDPAPPKGVNHKAHCPPARRRSLALLSPDVLQPQGGTLCLKGPVLRHPGLGEGTTGPVIPSTRTVGLRTRTPKIAGPRWT